MQTLVQEIEFLKKKRQAVILAHYYQREEVQDIADFVGDSLALSRRAAEVSAPVIVLAGVYFMAESAKILAPEKVVLIPDIDAGCPLADSISVTELQREKEKYPQAVVVCYVNTSADVKAESHICCTSSNAVKVVNTIPQNQILFVPDENLAHYVSRYSDKEIIPWKGECSTHSRITINELDDIMAAYPQAEVLVHPECSPEIVNKAHFVGSTGAIIEYASGSNKEEFIIGTEMGVLHPLQLRNPHKKFFLISQNLICPNMKLNNLEKIANCLRNMEPEVFVPEDICFKASQALEKMVTIK